MVQERVTREVVTAQRVHPDTPKKVASYSALYQLVYLVMGVIEGLLVLRFFFRMLGANPAAGFVRLIYSITNVLMAPFSLIFPTAVTEGAVFEWSILVAIIAYALFAWIITKLISIIFTADTPEAV